LKTLGKRGGVEILFALKDGRKKWADLEKAVKEKKSTSFRIKELLRSGLVQVIIIHDTPTGTKYYQLTPFGEKILEKIEEIERLVEEEKKKRLPEEPEEFVGEILKDE